MTCVCPGTICSQRWWEFMHAWMYVISRCNSAGAIYRYSPFIIFASRCLNTIKMTQRLILDINWYRVLNYSLRVTNERVKVRGIMTNRSTLNYSANFRDNSPCDERAQRGREIFEDPTRSWPEVEDPTLLFANNTSELRLTRRWINRTKL